ncbi:hypothetical protein AAG906_027972 [Vitis piasezkii]
MCGGDDHLAWKHLVSLEACKGLRTSIFVPNLDSPSWTRVREDRWAADPIDPALGYQTDVTPPPVVAPILASKDTHARMDRLEQRMRQMRVSEGAINWDDLMEHCSAILTHSGCKRLRGLRETSYLISSASSLTDYYSSHTEADTIVLPARYAFESSFPEAHGGWFVDSTSTPFSLILDWVPFELTPTASLATTCQGPLVSFILDVQIVTHNGRVAQPPLLVARPFDGAISHEEQVITVQSPRDMFVFSELVFQISHSEDDLFFIGFTFDEFVATVDHDTPFGLGFVPTEADYRYMARLHRERVRARLTYTPFDYPICPYRMSLVDYFARGSEETTDYGVDVEPIGVTDGVVPHDEYRDEMDMISMSQIAEMVSTIEIDEEIQKVLAPKLMEDVVVGATYQRVATTLFHDMMHRDVEVYVDDMIVKSRGRADHLAALERFFERIQKFRLRLNPKKCTFGVTFGKLLGHMVTLPMLGHPLLLYLSVLDMTLGCMLTQLDDSRKELRHYKDSIRALDFLPRFVESIKGSIVADHLASLPISEGIPVDNDFPDEEFIAMTNLSGWCMYFDGAANQSEFGIGILSVCLPFSDQHPATNNIVEYEACILGLETALELGIRQMEVFGDSNLDDLPWYHDIHQFLRSGTYPEAATTKGRRALRQLATRFMIYGETLYRRSADDMLLLCLDRAPADRVMREVHTRVCGPHMGGHMLAQFHALTSPWPFSVWGIDIIGKISLKSSSGHEFILVAIDYFTKWVEAASYARLTSTRVARATPYSLVYGMKVVFPVETKMGAVDHVQAYQRKMSRASRKQVKPRPLQKGDLVLRILRGLVGDPRGKFRPSWSEPYVIQELTLERAIWLTDLDGK